MVLRKSIFAALAFGLAGGVALRCKPSSSFAGDGAKAAKTGVKGPNGKDGGSGTGDKDGSGSEDDEKGKGKGSGKDKGGKDGKGSGKGTGTSGKGSGGAGGSSDEDSGDPDADEDGAGGLGSADTDLFPKGTLDGGGLLVDDGGTPCIDKLLPLHVVFVLDTTGSMGEELSNIVSNAQAFAQAVSNIKPQGSDKPIPGVKLGAILYVDEQGDNVSIPLSDAASFSAQMGGQDTRGGINDHCEGGIMAARYGMDMLQQGFAAEASGSIPVMIVISDNYSHDGAGPDGARSFDMSPLVNAASATQFKNLMLFDAVPTSSDVPGFTPCPGAPMGQGPNAQWEPIRQAWQAAHPTVKLSPGKNIGFPFTQNSLVNTLPQELASRLKLCKKG